jgi:hypothetical protein
LLDLSQIRTPNRNLYSCVVARVKGKASGKVEVRGKQAKNRLAIPQGQVMRHAAHNHGQRAKPVKYLSCAAVEKSRDTLWEACSAPFLFVHCE